MLILLGLRGVPIRKDQTGELFDFSPFWIPIAVAEGARLRRRPLRGAVLYMDSILNR